NEPVVCGRAHVPASASKQAGPVPTERDLLQFSRVASPSDYSPDDRVLPSMALGFHLPSRVSTRFAPIATAAGDARPARMVARTPIAPVVNPFAAAGVGGAIVTVAVLRCRRDPVVLARVLTMLHQV